MKFRSFLKIATGLSNMKLIFDRKRLANKIAARITKPARPFGRTKGVAGWFLADAGRLCNPCRGFNRLARKAIPENDV
jgi:hypothetical protein